MRNPAADGFMLAIPIALLVIGCIERSKLLVLLGLAVAAAYAAIMYWSGA